MADILRQDEFERQERREAEKAEERDLLKAFTVGRGDQGSGRNRRRHSHDEPKEQGTTGTTRWFRNF